MSTTTTRTIRLRDTDDLARPPWLPPEQWPFPIRHLDLGDRTVAYTDVGSGPTLLLVHVGMWSFVWRDLIEELRDEFRCVTLDAPGTGLSAGSSHVGIQLAADTLTTLVESLDLDDMVVAFHDLGGPAALTAATRWPHRIRALAAVNTFGWRPEGGAFRAMLALMGSAPMRGLDVWTGFLPRMTSTRFGVGRAMSKPARRAFRRGVDHRGRRSFHRYMRSVRHHDFSDVERTVNELSHLPLLTVFGENNDPLGFQPQWADRFADITQVVVPDGNHFPMCDDAELVATSVRNWHDRLVATTDTDALPVPRDQRPGGA